MRGAYNFYIQYVKELCELQSRKNANYTALFKDFRKFRISLCNPEIKLLNNICL